MGKSFITELDLLDKTYNYILNYDIKSIEKFILSSIKTPLIIVGSGGSYSAALAFDYFNQRAILKNLSKAVTPFELINYNISLNNMKVALLTAGGNNPDTINSYKYISKFEPKNFLTICLNKKSKIHTLANKYTRNILSEIEMASGKDGFLSVNSLVAMITLIAKAYGNVSDDTFFHFKEDFAFKPTIFDENIYNVLNKKTIVVLFGGLSLPVAIDLESKFTEAALGNIQLADYRNFAHGRHHWIARYNNDTSVVAFISPKEEKIALKTLSLIPDNIPIYKLKTEKDNFIGMFELFNKMFDMVALAGETQKRDPSNPQIPEYGRKIYHISFNVSSDKCLKALDRMVNRAAYRKCGAIQGDLFRQYKMAFDKFYNNLKDTELGGVIFDYDGTLKNKGTETEVEKDIFKKLNYLLDNGIRIGIATGRGKSVRTELQERIHSKYWGDVLIAYYNGGQFGYLSDNTVPNNQIETYASLYLLYNELTDIFDKAASIELRPCQLTIMQSSNNNMETFRNIILDLCLKYTDLKYFESGHSIDIIPRGNSKINIIEHFNNKLKYLCIGDSGQIAGNDYELLSNQFGISVKNVSPSLNACWNFAPIGIEGLDATLYYLDIIKITAAGNFYLEIKY